ncbi:MAG: hypothetical protein HC851_12090 [Acaryochloris sp. RU_4_1]|nr:hypothetical protein [Acaryochloris sp. RU_4_1]NJR54975.1 hypothetical protein [Acaryochloris sp. CRU_2_0]
MKVLLTSLFVVLLEVAWLFFAALPAPATTWELAAETEQGLVRQYFDRDSIDRSGTEITVKSYYIDERSSPQRTDYVTAYDCAVYLFKDMEINGQSTDSSWQPLVADPLNEALRDRLCEES